METFEGAAFHTSRWDYNVDLEGKRDRHHRHRRHRGAGDPGAGQDRRGAVRVPAHAVDHRRARPAGHHARGDRGRGAGARLGAGRRARFAKISAGRTAMKANDDYLAGKIDGLQGAQAARARADARGADGQAARHQLPDHGADPRPGRRDRRGPEDRRGAEAVLPVRLQAPDVPRRVPADVQPPARHPRRHRPDRASPRSTSAASCTTASSTRSTC